MFKVWSLLIFCISTTVLGSKFFSFWQTTTDNAIENNFEVYWNVPTFMCHKYGMYFEEVSSVFGMRQNAQDQFRGDDIFILYDPGYFPALIKNENGDVMRRNGGVPQEGNLTLHLQLFEDHVHEQVANESFRGIAVIDFESWRPIFRQNWASLNRYRELSIEIERDNHPLWSNNAIKNEAAKNFESHARNFMEETLKLAKSLRPFASWGYYAYPYCFNLSPNQPYPKCDPKIHDENNRISWLFSSQKVLFPSVYLRKHLDGNEKVGLIKGRVVEALRLAGNTSPRRKVMPYFWYKFQDSTESFLSRKDVEDGIREIVNRGSDGLIIWGSSNDLNNKAKCQELKDYLNDVLGPAVASIKEYRRHPDLTGTNYDY